MEPFITKLDQLLLTINSSIHEKINGINFLELLKFELIEKLTELDQKLLDELRLSLLDNNSFEKKYNLGNRSIICKINYFEKSVSKIKFKTEIDYLSIIICGVKKISIFDQLSKNKSIQLILSKNMGFVMIQDTIISSEINKNSIVLTFLNN